MVVEFPPAVRSILREDLQDVGLYHPFHGCPAHDLWGERVPLVPAGQLWLEMFEMRLLNGLMFSEAGNARNDLILCGIFLLDDCQKSNYFIKIIMFPKENKELLLKGEENTRLLMLQSIARPAPTLQPQSRVKTMQGNSREWEKIEEVSASPKQQR